MQAAPHASRFNGQGLLALVLGVTALHFGRDVLIPVALAILFTFLLAPVVSRLQHWGCDRGIAVALTTTVTFVIVAALLYVTLNQILGLIEDLPLHQQSLLRKIKGLSLTTGGGFERSAETVQELAKELQKSASGRTHAAAVDKVEIVAPMPNALQMLRAVFGPLIAWLAMAGIVVVLVIFMLLHREDVRDRVVRLVGLQRMHITVLALDDAAGRVSRYLRMQLLVNGIHGAAFGLALYLIGVPDAVMWGALTIMLRFIPFLGPILAAIGPVALSVAFFDNWYAPLLTLGTILTLELITNNFIEPRLYGASVGVSSLALILAAVFWTWLWGVPGLFLSTPLTVCLVVIGKYIPQLEFLSIVLSDKPGLEPSERFYQRLLANDLDEAEELVIEANEAKSLVEVCDTIVFPGLRFVEQDHDRGAIDDATRKRILEQLGILIDALIAPEVVVPSLAAETAAMERYTRLKVLLVPALDTADAIAARVFATALERAGIEAILMSNTILTGEMLELVDTLQPDLIFVSAVPPAAIIYARHLCKRVRARHPAIPIVVGLWNAQGELQKARERLGSVGANTVVDTATLGMEVAGRLLSAVRQKKSQNAPSAVA
jgi:predicted PurR-regulated permease PerM